MTILMLALLTMAGVIERTWWSVNSQHIGFVVEVVLLSIALVTRWCRPS